MGHPTSASWSTCPEEFPAFWNGHLFSESRGQCDCYMWVNHRSICSILKQCAQLCSHIGSGSPSVLSSNKESAALIWACGPWCESWSKVGLWTLHSSSHTWRYWIPKVLYLLGLFQLSRIWLVVTLVQWKTDRALSLRQHHLLESSSHWLSFGLAWIRWETVTWSLLYLDLDQLRSRLHLFGTVTVNRCLPALWWQRLINKTTRCWSWDKWVERKTPIIHHFIFDPIMMNVDECHYLLLMFDFPSLYFLLTFNSPRLPFFCICQ